MGYNTEFAGGLVVTPRPTPEHLATFHALLRRSAEADWCLPGTPRAGAPDTPCEYALGPDGWLVADNDGLKFLKHGPWLRWLVERWFKPRGYRLCGVIEWRGDEWDDIGAYKVEGHRIRLGVIEWKYPRNQRDFWAELQP